MNKKQRVLFIGDSMTDYAAYVSILETYFTIHSAENSYEFINIGLGSETASGLSEPSHPFPRPCVHSRLDNIIATLRPNYAVILYGINDGIYYPLSQESMDAYKTGMTTIVDKLHNCGAKVAIMTPAPFDALSYNGKLFDKGAKEYSFMEPYIFYNDVMEAYAEWLRTANIADKIVETRLALASWLRTQRLNDPYFKCGDGIHYNLEGNYIIAKTILKELFGHDLPYCKNNAKLQKIYKQVCDRQTMIHRYWKESIGHTSIYKDKYLPYDKLQNCLFSLDKKISKMVNKCALADKVSTYNDYIRYDCQFNGRKVIIVEPKIPTDKWLWRTEFFGAYDQADMELLKRGYYIVYYDIPNLYGAPIAIELMSKFYSFITSKLKLRNQALLFGFSRGALYAINYAAQYPQNVSAIYLDAPVVDICSWPQKQSPKDWQNCKKVYGICDGKEDRYRVILKATLDALVKNLAPIIIVAGNSDTIVPYNQNGAIIADCYKENGIRDFQVIMHEGDHHPHSLPNPQPIIEFLTKYTENETKINN